MRRGAAAGDAGSRVQLGGLQVCKGDSAACMAQQSAVTDSRLRVSEVSKMGGDGRLRDAWGSQYPQHVYDAEDHIAGRRQGCGQNWNVLCTMHAC